MTNSLRIMSMVCCVLLLTHNDVSSQESVPVYEKVVDFPDKFFKKVDEKISDINDRLVRQSQKYLQRLSREEERLRKKLAKKDSSAAARIFGDVASQYTNLQNGFKNKSQSVDKFRNKYIPHLDTLQTAFRFLQQTEGITGKASEMQGKLKDALGNMDGLQAKFNQAEEVKKYLKQRKDFLQSQLEEFGLAKELKKFKKEVYYYRQQVEEYKAIFDDPSKLEAKAIQLLSTTSLFQKFFANNSQLAGIFQLPGASSSSSQVSASFAGLQGRDAIQQEIFQRFGSRANVNQMVQQQVHQTQSPLDKLKNQLTEVSNGGFGNGNSDIDMPDFKPNSQKVKSFRERLEVGTNLQTVRSSFFFPATTDIALSVGYKLNDRSIIGIGSSYKLGLGKGWNNIQVSHQGIGLRSFLDFKIKGSFFIAGGYEQNYRAAFQDLQVLKNYSAWQSSGLVGLSKKYSVSKKVKGEMRLLWDFLSYRQIPRSQQLLFRIGYSLK